jgi:hypothetical protein
MGELCLDQIDKIIAREYERNQRDSLKEAEKVVEDFHSNEEPGEESRREAVGRK